jgi:hypothetical protein
MPTPKEQVRDQMEKIKLVVAEPLIDHAKLTVHLDQLAIIADDHVSDNVKDKIKLEIDTSDYERRTLKAKTEFCAVGSILGLTTAMGASALGAAMLIPHTWAIVLPILGGSVGFSLLCYYKALVLGKGEKYRLVETWFKTLLMKAEEGHTTNKQAIDVYGLILTEGLKNIEEANPEAMKEFEKKLEHVWGAQ